MRNRSLTRTRECLETTNAKFFGFGIAYDCRLVAAALAQERHLSFAELERIRHGVEKRFPTAELNDVLADACAHLFK